MRASPGLFSPLSRSPRLLCMTFVLAWALYLPSLSLTALWSLNSARRRLEASSKELQERTLEVAALGEALAARDRALDSANEQLRKVLEHNVLLSQENEIANQEAQRVSTDRDQLAHQLAVKVEEEEREAAACMAPGDEAHQDDEVRSLRRRLAYWRARDKSRDEQREEEKEAWRRDAAAHNSQRVAQDKVVARAQEESTKLAQEVNRLSALLGEANAEARRLAAVVERAGQQTAEMEWRLVEQVAGLEASLEKLAAAAAGSHAKHAHDTAEQERRHQLLCQQVEARMQAKSQALIDAQRRREQEAEEAASARVARVEESAEVELGHVREESRALSEAHMTIGAHLLAQITQADALLSATMALARHEEEARLRAASGARALEAAEAERHKVARSLAAESQRAEAASRQVQALQGELQQAEAKALRDQLAHEASTAGLQARLEAAEAAEQEERAREIMLQERSRLVETSEHQLKAAFARLVQVEHDRDREREALTKAFEIALEKIGRLHCAGTIASVAGAGEADLSKTADTRGDSERAERIGLPGELCAAGQALVRELEKDKTLLKAQIRELQDLLAKSTAALKAASEQMVAGCQAKVAVVAPTSGNSAPRTVSAPTYSIWRPMRTPTVGSDTDAVCMRAVTCVALAEGKETSPLQATQRKVFLSPPPPPQAGTRNPAWTHVVTPSEWARAEVV